MKRKVRQDTKCLACKKEIKKNSICEYSEGRGYICNECSKKLKKTIKKLIDKRYPDTCVCPLCKGKGVVNKIIAEALKNEK